MCYQKKGVEVCSQNSNEAAQSLFQEIENTNAHAHESGGPWQPSFLKLNI
jgi:hypothetical protein